jgi:hypothetical protein
MILNLSQRRRPRRRLNRSSPEPGVPGSVQHGNNLSKLGNGEIRDFSAVNLLILALMLLVRNSSD